MYLKKIITNLTRIIFTFLIFQDLCGSCAFTSVTTPINVSQLLEVVDGQIVSLREKNIPKAYYAYTSKDFKKATSLEDFEYLINSFLPLAQNKVISLNAIRFLDDSANYEGVVSSENNEKLIIEYQLIKEGPLWKINGLQIKNILPSQEKNDQSIEDDTKKSNSMVKKKIGKPV